MRAVLARRGRQSVIFGRVGTATAAAGAAAAGATAEGGAAAGSLGGAAAGGDAGEAGGHAGTSSAMGETMGDSDSGGRRAYVPTQVSSTSSSEEYAATVRSRIQPAMVSTLPIGWDSGSSWNPTPENSFQTSLQRQHSGQVCGSGSKNNWEGKNTRRLGRNRSVLKSQIQLG